MITGLPGLHRIRVIRGLTQDELGERIGRTGQIIGQYELGKRNPSLPVVQMIMKVLKCSYKDLMTEDKAGPG
jgi:transcriptional regulator with XRE-family HTH domain